MSFTFTFLEISNKYKNMGHSLAISDHLFIFLHKCIHMLLKHCLKLQSSALYQSFLEKFFNLQQTSKITASIQLLLRLKTNKQPEQKYSKGKQNNTVWRDMHAVLRGGLIFLNWGHFLWRFSPSAWVSRVETGGQE